MYSALWKVNTEKYLGSFDCEAAQFMFFVRVIQIRFAKTVGESF